MIDINELRRKVNSTDVVDHIDLHANIKTILSELLDRLEATEKERDAMRAMLRAALGVLEEVKGNINPERGYADELEADVERAIAATVIPGVKGE